MRKIKSHSPQETASIAKKMAKKYSNGGVFCLKGELGAGKTVFVKGFASGLKIDPKTVKSPTYTYVRSYRVGGKWLHHFDFYRVKQIDDLMLHDIEEMFSRSDAWVLIEWPERLGNHIPQNRIEISIEYISDSNRLISFKT